MTPAQEEHAAAVRLAALQKMIDAALARNDAATATTLLRSAEAASKLVAACRQARTQYEIGRGALLARDEVSAYFDRYIGRLKELIEGMPSEVALECSPTDPGQVVQVLDRWIMHRLNPALQEVRGFVEESQKIANDEN